MPKHQDAPQLRAARHPRGDPGIFASVCPKLSGFSKPSKANEPAFTRAVDEVARAARALLDALVTNAPPRDREVEASKARAKGVARFRSNGMREPGV